MRPFRKMSAMFFFFFPAATQVSSSELQDVFQETSSNIFQINANGEWIKVNKYVV